MKIPPHIRLTAHEKIVLKCLKGKINIYLKPNSHYDWLWVDGAGKMVDVEYEFINLPKIYTSPWFEISDLYALHYPQVRKKCWALPFTRIEFHMLNLARLRLL